MELPPYHIPSAGMVLRHAGERMAVSPKGRDVYPPRGHRCLGSCQFPVGRRVRFPGEPCRPYRRDARTSFRSRRLRILAGRRSPFLRVLRERGGRGNFRCTPRGRGGRTRRRASRSFHTPVGLCIPCHDPPLCTLRRGCGGLQTGDRELEMDIVPRRLHHPRRLHGGSDRLRGGRLLGIG